MTTPPTPPAIDQTNASAKNCRSRRPGLAPKAVRTAISRVRPVARINNKLAMFAEAQEGDERRRHEQPACAQMARADVPELVSDDYVPLAARALWGTLGWMSCASRRDARQ